jgi:hypothetical protein
MYRHITHLSVALLLLFLVCEPPVTSAALESSQKTVTVPVEQVPAVTTAKLLLQEPVQLQRYEVPSQALPQWFALRDTRPALLFYANDPLLQSTTAAMQRNLLARLVNPDHEALRIDIADPAILPKMTLAAALQAGLFSSVYWVMPVGTEMSNLSIDTFRKQMVQLGAVNIEAAKKFTLRDGVFSGMLRGVPFHALHPQADFTITGPVAFHFDLGYLAPLYKGEIKTPIYPLIYQTLKHLRAQKVEIIATSLSYSQLSGEVPLGSRFIGEVFDLLLKQPKMLDEKMPAMWRERANALYLPEMFMANNARNLLLQQLEQHPDDPSLHFALYQVSRDVRSARHAALGHLADAVQRDPVYALEYLLLAPVAREKGHPDEALRMLRLAHEGYSDNPIITLELARALLSANHGDGAIPLLQQLLALNWSSTIYPDMPEFLQQLLTEADRQKSTPNSRQQ